MNENLLINIKKMNIEEKFERMIKMNILKPNLKKYNNDKIVKEEINRVINSIFFEGEMISENKYNELINNLNNL